MGFYFRKSVGFGPFRLNLSKSGIGASFGVRGARVSSGPRGTYVNLGRDGFYYRQKIDSPLSGASHRPGNPLTVNTSDNESRIDSADVARLVDSSSEELVKQINACAARIRYAPIIAIGFGLLAMFYLVAASGAEQSAESAYSSAAKVAQDGSDAADKAYKISLNKKLKLSDRRKANQQYKLLEIDAKTADSKAKASKAKLAQLRHTLSLGNILLLVLGAMGALAVIFVYRRDVLARQKPVTYAFDEHAKSRFDGLQQGCEKLAQANRVWRVETQHSTSEWKRSAGANSLITRSQCQIGKASPPHIKTNIVPWSIECNGMRLFFLPDKLFVRQSGRYGIVSYDSLSVDVSATNFRERNSVPSDATIAGYTWLYVNKNGGPDRRFSNNRQIPIAIYPELDLRSSQGFHILLQVSNTSRVAAFAAAMHEYVRTGSPDPRQKRTEGDQQESHRPQTQSSKDQNKSAFEDLGVGAGASKEEIKAAYHRMAQQYHPDKVATLAPEFRELAERRMKEINAAYQQLESR